MGPLANFETRFHEVALRYPFAAMPRAEVTARSSSVTAVRAVGPAGLMARARRGRRGSPAGAGPAGRRRSTGSSRTSTFWSRTTNRCDPASAYPFFGDRVGTPDLAPFAIWDGETGAGRRVGITIPL